MIPHHFVEPQSRAVHDAAIRSDVHRHIVVPSFCFRLPYSLGSETNAGEESPCEKCP